MASSLFDCRVCVCINWTRLVQILSEADEFFVPTYLDIEIKFLEARFEFHRRQWQLCGVDCRSAGLVPGECLDLRGAIAAREVAAIKKCTFQIPVKHCHHLSVCASLHRDYYAHSSEELTICFWYIAAS